MTEVTQIEISRLLESGVAELRGQAASGVPWRGSREPGDGLSDLPPAVQAAIETHWAEEVGEGEATETRAERWARETAEPEPSLEEVRAEALARIDAEAERERLRYITPGSGQAMVYLAKEAQARACLADGDPDPGDYPLLAATIGIERAPVSGDPAQSVTEVAAIVLAVAGGWAQVAAAIEAERLTAKAAAEAAEDEAAIAALFPLAWPLPGGEEPEA